MNIPSIFSVSKLLTPASFKEELTSIYNIASAGRMVMDKLWVLYWLTASLVQGQRSFELCNKLMIVGFLNEDETNELNLILMSLVKKSNTEEFKPLLDFSSRFCDPELLIRVINDNFIDILAIEFTSMLVESINGVNKVLDGKTEVEIQIERTAKHYFTAFFKNIFYEQVEKPLKEICETEKTSSADGEDLLKGLLDNFLVKVQEQIKSFKFHTVKKHHIEKIQQQQKPFASF